MKCDLFFGFTRRRTWLYIDLVIGHVLVYRSDDCFASYDTVAVLSCLTGDSKL